MCTQRQTKIAPPSGIFQRCCLMLDLKLLLLPSSLSECLMSNHRAPMTLMNRRSGISACAWCEHVLSAVLSLVSSVRVIQCSVAVWGVVVVTSSFVSSIDLASHLRSQHSG